MLSVLTFALPCQLQRGGAPRPSYDPPLPPPVQSLQSCKPAAVGAGPRNSPPPPFGTPCESVAQKVVVHGILYVPSGLRNQGGTVTLGWGHWTRCLEAKMGSIKSIFHELHDAKEIRTRQPGENLQFRPVHSPADWYT